MTTLAFGRLLRLSRSQTRVYSVFPQNDPELDGRAIYIWGYNQKEGSELEWILITNPAWSFPHYEPLLLEPALLLDLADGGNQTVAYGQLNDPNGGWGGMQLEEVDSFSPSGLLAGGDELDGGSDETLASTEESHTSTTSWDGDTEPLMVWDAGSARERIAEQIDRYLARQHPGYQLTADEDGETADSRRGNLDRWIHRMPEGPDGVSTDYRELVALREEPLQERLAERRIEFRDAWERAEEFSRRTGFPLHQPLPGGGSIDLIGIFPERGPIFYSTLNADGAEMVSTDQLWTWTVGEEPNAEPLEGQGTTIAMWDSGKAWKESEFEHVEFEGAGIAHQDDLQHVVNHAVRVAGTLIARGVNPSARGMSPAADLLTYRYMHPGSEPMDDISSMGQAQSEHSLLLSNHSYGSLAGWFVGSWYGDPGENLNEVAESWIFGFYTEEEAAAIDSLVHARTTYLPVWAAGNDRMECSLEGCHFEEPSDCAETVLPEKVETWHWVWARDTNYQWQFHDGVCAFRYPNGWPYGYDTLRPQAVAKNVLTVGAVQRNESDPNTIELWPLSSWGPTDDGRIKPDLMAKGAGVLTTDYPGDTAYDVAAGTSFAAPIVTGSLNLLLQLYTDRHPEAPPLLASTTKALAIHTATSMAQGGGPDYRHGWGLLNAERAGEVILDNHASGSRSHIKEIVLVDGDFIEFPVVATGDEPLVVTICWTDPAGDPPSISLNPDPNDPDNIMLVNDLDLRIERESNSVVYEPWILDPLSPWAPATTGDNYRDNVEQVWIQDPVAGETYIVRVTHKGLLAEGFQEVSMILTGNVPDPKPPLHALSIERTAEDEFTVAWPAIVGQPYELELSEDLV